MKIAIFHNFMSNIGGAEVVTLTLARELNADVYTTSFDIKKIRTMGFEDVVERIYSVGGVPKISPFRQQIAFFRFRLFRPKRCYDAYIISGDWAMSGAMRNRPILWYIHGPMNELWEFKEFIRNNLLPFWKRPLYDLWVAVNRMFTLHYAHSVDAWVCNSRNTQERVRRFYEKNAEIIYPPISVSEYQNHGDEGYWLSVNRLFFQKRVDMQIEAFRKMPNEKLIIVGSYEKETPQFESYRKYLESICPENVKILHWVPAEELKDLYSRCRGFIASSVNEDFGMSIVEAMASGKPVIAPDEGGYRESVIDGKTGMLLKDIDASKIRDAVQLISDIISKHPDAYVAASRAQAEKFDTKVFMKKIRARMNDFSRRPRM